MKRLINILLFMLCSIVLSGCYQDLEKTSLDEYILHINKHKIGYSSVEIDHPDYFLPSLTFIQDYEYIDGSYYWREDDPLRGVFTSNVNPEISFLCLEYDEAIYYNAKEFMLKEIEPYNNKFYEYNNYTFYENSNFINLHYRDFPEWFTMVCYNDVNFTLIFIGLYSGTLAGPSCLEGEYLEDIEGNWISFIEQYYAECYDFQ